jgi:uncharacterized membrane protein
MTMMDQPMTATPSRTGDQPAQQRGGKQQSQQEQNVGQAERVTSVAAGSILAILGLSRGSLPGLLIAGVGGAMAYRGLSGHCPISQALGVNTAETDEESLDRAERRTHEKGIHVEQCFLINRSLEDLYKYWRDFTNLPRIMTHLQSVEVKDDKHSHWVAKAPAIAGGSVEWDAEITRDDPNSVIGWRSLPGSQVDTAGEIRFSKAMGDRGTEIHVFMDYIPPAGRVGHWIATLFGEAPARQMRDDLRNFKALMETGEIPTTSGQPRGTCLGQGKRDRSTERFAS